MAQFDIYPGTGQGCDFLLELQNNMLDDLSTRVVAPLAGAEALGLSMRLLNPRLVIDGRPYVLLTHLLAAIPKKSLGQSVGNASSQRDEIVGSIDMLFTGI
jgi:toxin CcdB